MFNSSMTFNLHNIFYLYTEYLGWTEPMLLCLLDKYLGPGLVLGVGFSLRSSWPQKAILLLFGGYIFLAPYQALNIPLSKLENLMVYSSWTLIYKDKTRLRLSYECPSKHLLVWKTSSTRLQRNNFTSCKTSWRHLARRLEDFLEDEKLLCWRRLEDMSWRRLEGIMETGKILIGDICI